MAQDIDEQSELAQSGARIGNSGEAPDNLSADLQQHHAQMRDAAASIDQHLQQMVSWKEQLEQQMDLLRRDGLKVLEQQKRLVEEEGRLATQAETLAAERATLASQRASLADEQRSITAALENQRREIEAERTELEAQRVRIEPEMRRLAEREQAISEREQGLVDRETRLSQEQGAVASRSEALAAERQAIEARGSELQRMLAEIDEGRTRLEADKQSAADALAQSEAALKTRTEAMHRRETELAEALLLLGTESQRLQERRAELERAGTSDALQATCAALTGEKARLEARLSESEKILNEMQARSAALAAKIEELTAQRIAANDRTIEYQATVASVEARLAELEAEKSTVAAQLAAAQARAKEVAERAADWETQNRVLSDENTALSSERAKLADQIGRLTTQNTAVQAELTRLTSERDAAAQETADAAKSTDTRTAEFEKLATELRAERTALIAKSQTLERERAELIDQGKRLEARSTELEQRCAELTAALDPAERAAGEERNKATGLKERNALLEQNIRALQTELDTALAQHDARVAALIDERAAQQQRTDAAVQHEAELERALSEARAQLEAARGSAHDLGDIASVTDPDKNEIGRLRSRIEELEAERDALAERISRFHPRAEDPQPAFIATTSTPDESGAELIQDAEYVGNNNEQFGEIDQNEQPLEEQEPQTLQTPARSSAIMTVATIGLCVLLVLGLPFAGVYSLVSPEYRSEAVVQLLPPSQFKKAQIPNWLARQVKDVGTNPDVLQEAWEEMRDMGYSRYDSKDNWLAALPREMEVMLDTPSNKMTIRILGDSKAAVCLAANSLAAAYADKAVLREGPSSSSGKKAVAVLAVPATPSAVTVNDHRLDLAASISAALVFISLAVLTHFQRAVVKDPQAIDQMAEKREDVPASPPVT